MDTTQDANTSLESPRWEWRRVKMRRPAGGHSDSRPKGGRWRWVGPRDPRQPLTLSIKFRGGPECWYEVHARGQVGRFPGYVSIHEIMDEINTGGAAARNSH